jgi:hypothetical protein
MMCFCFSQEGGVGQVNFVDCALGKGGGGCGWMAEKLLKGRSKLR